MNETKKLKLGPKGFTHGGKREGAGSKPGHAPTHTKSNPLSEQVYVRFTKEQRQSLDKQATEKDMKLSDYIRYRLFPD